MKPIRNLLFLSAAPFILTACLSGGGSSTTQEEKQTPAAQTPVTTTTTDVPVANDISFGSTSNNDVVTGRLMTVTGKATDTAGIDNVKVEVSSGTTSNSNAFSISATNSTSYTADIDSEGNFSAEVALNAGANTLNIIITSNSGTQTSKSQVVMLGTTIAAGNSHTGTIVDGKIYTWGRNNKGQLGLGTISKISENQDNPGTHPLTPQLIKSETRFVSLSFQQNSSLALDDAGNVWSWGYGKYGQLGHGNTQGTEDIDETDLSAPKQIAGLTDVVAISRSTNHSVVLKADGTVCAFGSNKYGQLGNGNTTHSGSPVCNNGLVDIVQISANGDTTFALNGEGKIWGFGRNNYGQLGLSVKDTDEHSTAVQIPVPDTVSAIANGKGHVLALTTRGEVYAWGLNSSSQVGLNESETWEDYILAPKLLPWFNSEKGVANAVWANGNQSYVRKSDMKVYPWGQSVDGTLGVPSAAGLKFADVEEPIAPISNLDNVRNLGVGALHTIAIQENAQLFTWGWSFEGSLGGGDATIDKWSYIIPLAISTP